MANITATQVLDLARSQIGVKATDIKRCKYNKWYYGADVSGSGYDWCEVFVQWLFAQLKASYMLYLKTANVGYQAIEFQKRGKLVTKNYKPGDIVIFSWSGQKSTWISGVKTLDHIGIIEKVNSNGTYTTIEGNTGNTKNGEVKRQTRYASQISCACRPDYKSESATTYTVTMLRIYKGAPTNTLGQVLTLQRILNELQDGKGYRGKDGKKLALDGEFGDNTEYALNAYKKVHGLPQNGICEQADWSKLLCEYKKKI